jgi:hypothetical protein
MELVLGLFWIITRLLWGSYDSLWVSWWFCHGLPKSKFRMLHGRFAELTFSFGSVTDATGQGPDMLSFKVNCQDDSRRRLLHCISSSLINIDIDST